MSSTAPHRLPMRHERVEENHYLSDGTAQRLERQAIEHYVALGPAAALAWIDQTYGGEEGFGRRFVDLYERAGSRERLRLLELEAKIRGWVSDQSRQSGPTQINIHMTPAPEVKVRGKDGGA